MCKNLFSGKCDASKCPSAKSHQERLHQDKKAEQQRKVIEQMKTETTK